MVKIQRSNIARDKLIKHGKKQEMIKQSRRMNDFNLKYRYVIMLAKNNKMKNYLFINKQNESLLCQMLKDY